MDFNEILRSDVLLKCVNTCNFRLKPDNNGYFAPGSVRISVQISSVLARNMLHAEFA
jgi:hypothetical protein